MAGYAHRMTNNRKKQKNLASSCPFHLALMSLALPGSSHHRGSGSYTFHHARHLCKGQHLRPISASGQPVLRRELQSHAAAHEKLGDLARLQWATLGLRFSLDKQREGLEDVLRHDKVLSLL